MGINTGFTVEVVHFPGRGSDYFGPCEICNKSMPETAVFTWYKLFKHEDGFLYLSAPSAGIYAHMGCRLYEGHRIASKATLPMRGRLTEYPRYALRSDLLAAGFSESSADQVMP